MSTLAETALTPVSIALHHEIAPAVVGAGDGAFGAVGHSHGVTPIDS